MLNMLQETLQNCRKHCNITGKVFSIFFYSRQLITVHVCLRLKNMTHFYVFCDNGLNQADASVLLYTET